MATKPLPRTLGQLIEMNIMKLLRNTGRPPKDGRILEIQMQTLELAIKWYKSRTGTEEEGGTRLDEFRDAFHQAHQRLPNGGFLFDGKAD